MNFISNNPSSIPICHICNTSKSIEQFSKSQRKRFKNKKTATCKQCQENPKLTETKTKPKRKGGNLRGGCEAPPRRLLHPLRFCFRICLNLRLIWITIKK